MNVVSPNCGCRWNLRENKYPATNPIARAAILEAITTTCKVSAVYITSLSFTCTLTVTQQIVTTYLNIPDHTLSKATVLYRT